MSAIANEPSPDAGRVELFDRWLRVHFAAESPVRSADFHYLWLRHQCEKDRHPQTRERVVDASELPERIRPRAAAVEPVAPGADADAAEGGELVVRWDEPGDRVSRYPLGWLRAHAYGAERGGAPPPPSDTAALTLHAADYPDDAALVKALLERTASAGAAVVRGYRRSSTGGAGGAGAADPADTEALIDALAAAGLQVTATHFGRIEDLRTDNTTNQNTDQLGYTDAAIEAHTDQPFLERPPRYQLLHCVRPADRGGENYVVDGLAAARYLESVDAESSRVLRTTPVHFHRRQRAFERRVVSPILRLPEDGSFQIRYSYFTMAPQRLPFSEMDGFYRAYRRFAEIVRAPQHQYRMRLEAGDFLLYDNHRMLHARTGFSGARWVRGVYFDG